MNADGTQRTQDAQVETTAQQALPDQPVRTHQDVLQLIADVERQLERMREAQTRSTEEIAQFSERRRILEEREHEIHSSAAMLTAREAQLHAMADAIRIEEIRLAERQQEIERVIEALDHRSSMIERSEAALVADRASVDEARVAFDAARVELNAECACVAEERATFAAESRAMAEARQVADAALAARESEITALNVQLSSLQRDRGEIEALRAAGSEAVVAAERNAASLMLTVTALREQVADTESSLASRDAVVESKDAAITERDRRISDLERDVEVNRQSLRTAGDKLAALAKSVADQAPQLERGAAAMAVVGESRQILAAKDSRIAALEADLAKAVAAASAIPATVVDTAAVEAAAAELEGARGEIDRLRSEIAAANRAADTERTSKRSSAADAERAMAETQGRLNEALTFLASRKQRIDLATRLHRERRARREREVRQATENSMIKVLEEGRMVKKQREELRHVQEMLTTTEKSMLQRYARHRGGLVAAWCLIVTGAVATGSWFAADSVLPKTSVASVDLIAKPREGDRLSPEADTAFQSVHREALGDIGFRDAVKKRLTERGVNTLRGSGAFDGWLDGVELDSDGPGSLRLVAEGPDAQTAIIALDTLATTLVSESAKLAKGRGDVPLATIAGNSQVPGRVTFSSLVPQQGPLDRLMAAGMVFSGVMTLGLIVGFVTFGRIARTKRRFEEAERFGASL